MAKKSQVLMYGLLAGLVLAVILSMISSLNRGKFDVIGDSSLALIGISKEAEKALFYIDQSAKYSLQQAVYDISKDGGISEIENLGTDEAFADYKCGKFNDAYVWLKVKKTDLGYSIEECFDEKSASAYLMYLFESNLNDYFARYPLDIPTEGYSYDIKDNSDVVGIGSQPIRIDIIFGEKLELGSKPYRPAKPIEFKVDSEGNKIEVVEGKKTTDDKSLKSLKDFTSVSSDTIGKEKLDIAGLCPRGRKCVLTKEAYDLLLQAQKKAKEKKLSIEVTSSYRSFQQQKDIWEGKTASKYNVRYPTKEERRAYVCYPYEESPQDNVEKRCPHLSGNAVDLKFKDKSMTMADWQLLHSVMASAGWVMYAKEPWHFECCGTDRDARAKQQGVDVIA